jgi:RNA polymerase II subunit A-like phosphatase
MVCIIDDREDVWSNASNLIHVKPYHFFQHTGDINAPPGLDKHENDNKAGVDLTRVKDSKINEQNVNSNKTKSTTDDHSETLNENKNNIILTDEKKENNVEEDALRVANINGDAANSNENKDEKAPVENSEKSPELCEKATSEQCEKATSEQCEKTTSEQCQKPSEQDQSKTSADMKNELDEKANSQSGIKCQENNLVEIEDSDDYLLHLEDILKRIHEAFYEDYDKMESGEVPDLKKVIPMVRGRVLKGCKLVFSGLVPTHIKLEQSKAYQIAKSLGAEVTQELQEDTTHLVAVRPGTAKVNAGRRKKNLKIVTPDWLWSCAERWEHVDEKIFALNSKGSKNRHPPPHCSSPEHIINYPEHNTPAMRKRTPSGRFMDTINPLMSFSSADIADMDKEVEDILDDESDSSEDETSTKVAAVDLTKNEENSSTSSSEDSLTGEYPKGYKRKREENNLVNDVNNSTEDDESPSIKFRRGELVESELDIEQDSQDSDGSVEAPDEVDDGEWNMMGAALEREFLSNN